MHHIPSIFLLTALAVLSEAQIEVNTGSCPDDCMIASLEASSCLADDDASCVCRDATWMTNLNCCIVNNCQATTDEAETDRLGDYLQTQCAAIGITLTPLDPQFDTSLCATASSIVPVTSSVSIHLPATATAAKAAGDTSGTTTTAPAGQVSVGPGGVVAPSMSVGPGGAVAPGVSVGPGGVVVSGAATVKAAPTASGSAVVVAGATSSASVSGATTEKKNDSGTVRVQGLVGFVAAAVGLGGVMVL